MITITVDGLDGNLAGQLMANPEHGIVTLRRRPDGYQVTGIYSNPDESARLLLAVRDAQGAGTWPTKQGAARWLTSLARMRMPAPRRSPRHADPDRTVALRRPNTLPADLTAVQQVLPARMPLTPQPHVPDGHANTRYVPAGDQYPMPGFLPGFPTGPRS